MRARRLERAYPVGAGRPVLRDVQHALAREYGHESWIALKRALSTAGRPRARPRRGAAHGRRLRSPRAATWCSRSTSRDEAALQRLNAHYERAFTFDDLWAEIWRRVYAFRQRVVQGADELSAARRSAQAHRAGRRLRQLGRADEAMATGAPPSRPTSTSIAVEERDLAAAAPERRRSGTS